MFVYLDESGDLGWKFNAPYRRGGSSRHITIASLVVPSAMKHLPKRLITKLYKKCNWSPVIEKKWADMSAEERVLFAQKARELRDRYPNDIKYLSITVKKENVKTHIRTDPNTLYNRMIEVSLLDEMSQHPRITFVPDPRSIKVESGNSLHDYLQTKLWFERNAITKLSTNPIDSASSKNVQFADMLSGVVQGHFEDGKSQAWSFLREGITSKRLFF